MKLFGYWRSSATYRVRIALNLKDLDYTYSPVNLLKGEQKGDAYLAINPLGVVPSLVTADGDIINQSLAIMEYLETAYPTTSIIPPDPIECARMRAIAQSLASEAQPFGNLGVQVYLRQTLKLDDAAITRWLDKFPGSAMRAIEKMVEKYGGDFCIGNKPSIADACLVPQIYANERFNVDMSGCPKLIAIAERCRELPAFKKAHPNNQPDKPTS